MAKVTNAILGLSFQEIERHLNEAYLTAIRTKAESKPGSSDLVALDGWYQSQPLLSLPASKGKGKDSSKDGADDVFGSKDGLVRLMTWKLSREKQRPTLMSLIRSNSVSDVVQTVAGARAHLLTALASAAVSGSTHLDLHDAKAVQESKRIAVETMKLLTALRGVGPATSSAIVASWYPHAFFLSDELAAILFPNQEVKYTWSFYDKLHIRATETLIALAKQNPDTPVSSGKCLERLAWSLVHSPGDASTKAQGQDLEEKTDSAKLGKRTTPSEDAKADTKASKKGQETKPSPHPPKRSKLSPPLAPLPTRTSGRISARRKAA